MKKAKNNSGSVLILVVLVIGVLSIIGTSVLSAALSNYKMKVTSSALKTNLYLAEAGFEETYQKIYNKVTEAVSEANEIAMKNIKGYYAPDSSYIEYNDVNFNKALFYISEHPELVELSQIQAIYPYITRTDAGEYVYNDVYIENQAKAAFKKTYTEYIKQHLCTIVSDPITGMVDSSAINSSIKVYAKKSNEADAPAIDRNIVFSGIEGNEKTTIYLQSSYSDSKAQRKAEVALDICIPKYHEPYSIVVEGKQLKVNPLWTKAISTDSKLLLDGAVNIRGSIYSDDNVEINGDSKITGNLATRSNMIVSSNSDVITSDIYCHNIELDGSNISFKSSGNDEYNGLYVEDDFEMNGRKQTVNIQNNYYGFSDGSAAAGNNPDNSSGININSDDIDSDNVNNKSSFTLNGDIYLYGTSYIHGLSAPYQTGESISVKGNYIAYSMPLVNGTYKDENVVFEYIDPLTLVTKKNTGEALSVFDKNKYFFEYYVELKNGINNGKLYLKNVNITPGNSTVTLGDVISSNEAEKVKIGNYDFTQHAEIFSRLKNIYFLKTNALGDKDIAKVNSDTFPSNFNTSCPIISVNNDVAFSHVKTDYTGQGYLLKYINDGSNITIQLNGGETKGYFIVTNGDVTIKGDGKIAGCIVSKGNVKIEGNVDILYNERIVMKAFSDNEWLISEFKQHDSAAAKNYTVTSVVEIETGDMNVSNVDYTDLLKFRNWKIDYED